MAIVKTMSPLDQEGLLRGEPAQQLVKTASSGLKGEDFRALVKRAGHFIADSVRSLRPDPGEVLVHSIALGALEWYGPNRNGDGFKEAACKKYHKTFEKYARAYRDHENKDPSKSYGLIKLALYNEPMHRIELIMALNATKEAAERNGGLVADKELEALEKKGDYDTSMACKVPFDVCSVCGNRARTRADYCTGLAEGGHCKGGGLKNNIATVLSDGTQVYAENPDPLWFDNSNVWRHADRIASASGILKAAGVTARGGAALAEALGVTMPRDVALAGPDGTLPYALKLASQLAAAEDRLARSAPRDSLALAFLAADRPAPWSDHGGTLPQALAALAAEKVAAPLAGFLEMVTGSREKAAVAEPAVRGRLPGVYGRMLEDGVCDGLAAENPFAVGRQPPPPAVRDWARKLAADHSLEHAAVLRRATRAALYHAVPPPPAAAPAEKRAGAAEELARAYALYKLAFLQAVAAHDRDFDLTRDLVVRQNYL